MLLWPVAWLVGGWTLDTVAAVRGAFAKRG